MQFNMLERLSATITYTLIFILVFTHSTQAQTNRKFNVSLSYSPNLSFITNALVTSGPHYKLSHNAFVGVEYNALSWLKPTLALGYLNTGEAYKGDFTDANGVISGKLKINYNNNYFVVPLGVKCFVNSVFIHPEVGLAYNLSNINHIRIDNNDGSEINTKEDAQLFSSALYNKTTVPVMLTVGTEFKVGATRLMAGLKSYYSINQVVEGAPRDNHYYGLGLLLGAKF